VPRYHYHVIADPESCFPAAETLPSVDADSPADAVAKLADQGHVPSTGEGLYLRLVTDNATYLMP